MLQADQSTGAQASRVSLLIGESIMKSAYEMDHLQVVILQYLHLRHGANGMCGMTT